MKKLVGVFGPGDSASGSPEYREAEALGAGLADRGFTIVTGGYAGIMEAASKGAREKRGQVVGVTAEVYYARGTEANPYLTREIKVKSAVDRLMELIDLSDCYAAIGNSSGTLVEVMTVYDYIVKKFIEPKPLVLIGDAWKDFEVMITRGDHFKGYLSILSFVANATEALAFIENRFGPQLKYPDLSIIQS